MEKTDRPDGEKPLPKWSKWLYYYECIPPKVRGTLYALAVVIALALGAVIGMGYVSHKWPNAGLYVAYGDFSLSTKSARTNMQEIQSIRDNASLAAGRIEAIDKRVANQRDTIDSAFKTAAEAKTLSGSAKESLSQVEDAVQKANQSMTNLQEEAEFYAKIRRASLGYAKDYDELSDMQGPTGRGAEAFNAKRAIMLPFFGYGETYRPPGRLPAKFDPKTVTISELQTALPGLLLDSAKEVVFWVYEQERFTKDEKLKFLAPIAQTDPNLYMRAGAGYCYMQLAEIIRVNPLSGAHVKEDFEKRFGKSGAK